MTTKTTGAEWKRFYSDKKAWPKGAYYEDEDVTVDGRPWTFEDTYLLVSDNAKITVSGGTVFLMEDDKDGPTLESHFKNWRNQQKNVVFVCAAPIELEETVKSAIRAAGGKC